MRSSTLSSADKPSCRRDRNSFTQETLPVVKITLSDVKCLDSASTGVFLNKVCQLKQTNKSDKQSRLR